MKLSSIFTIFAVASADPERKVPPRTPDQRLNTLHRFVTNWIDSQISIDQNRPQRAETMKSSFDRLYQRQLDAFEECGFFNPSLEHGGPKPISRRRRSGADNVFDDAESEYALRGILEVRNVFLINASKRR